MHPEPTHLPVPAKVAATSLLKSLAAELAAVGVLEVWLFGSVARGDDGADSDIDIAIRVTKPRFAAKIAAEDILRPCFERHVDVALLPFTERLSYIANDDLVRVV